MLADRSFTWTKNGEPVVENQVLRVHKIYLDKGLENKPISQMTLEEKGLLLQLNIGDPFAGEPLIEPAENMSPEEKGALLLRYVTDGSPLYRTVMNEHAQIGERLLLEEPLHFRGVNLDVLGLIGADPRHANLRNANAREANLNGCQP
jgi:Pentapeptide repeats (8 copies)